MNYPLYPRQNRKMTYRSAHLLYPLSYPMEKDSSTPGYAKFQRATV